MFCTNHGISQFNTTIQLGPSTQSTVTPRNSAMVITIPVKGDDILILASDGLSDNLWDEDVLDEVVRFKKSFLNSAPATAVRH
jgi:serine/threonine protein phosphatase PrpC